MLEPTVSPVQAQAYVNAGALIIDVREQDEWDEKHVAGTQHIPLDAVASRTADIPRDRDVILICRSGRRSGMAQKTLFDLGYTRVANLEGGILAWEEAALPLVRA